MNRLLAAFAVLFLCGLAGLSLLPTPPHSEAQPAAAADAVSQAGSASRPSVRVVYPATTDGAAQSNTTAASVPVPVAPTVTPAAQVQPTPEPVRGQTLLAGETAAAPAVDPVVQVGAPTLNLNTASIDALNGLAGAGHIGRTIASHRPYRSVEDLLTKRVVRKSVYDRIKDQVATE